MNNVFSLPPRSPVYSFDWLSLSEEGRYGIWTQHLESGGQELGYVEFCELMDEIVRRFQ